MSRGTERDIPCEDAPLSSERNAAPLWDAPLHIPPPLQMMLQVDRSMEAMGDPGKAALQRWLLAWEAQQTGYFCAPASALAALRFLGVASDWSQWRIFQEVIQPNGLLTAGVSLRSGAEMLRYLSSFNSRQAALASHPGACSPELQGTLRVEEVCSSDPQQLAMCLERDLHAAFEDGQEVCLLANYWRPSGGHWSPIAGWVPPKDASDGLVFILDTNSQRHPPHWLRFSELVEAMCRHNAKTGRARGYVKLRVSDVSQA
mmetsp:Transcript_36972/g.85292  ORF Transcript_36972/g.85292 Transcript_36972/m.85292 type:complete len:259 (-) Transcript_36972:65-841(-)